MMHRQTPLTVNQAITLLILSLTALLVVAALYNTPIEQLRENMIDVYINHNNSVKNTDLLISKIVASSKDAERCAGMFNNVFMPAVQLFNDNSIVSTKENTLQAIDIVINGISGACQ